MKKWIIALLIAVLPGMALAGGTPEDVQFYSESLGKEMEFRVYLPEGYDPERGPKYPVVYFLHGTDYPYWAYWDGFQMTNILDDLIEGGVIRPTIFVAPDGLVGPYNGSWWTNSELYGDFEDYVAYDLVSFVDENYRTKANRPHRSIMGLSMGGYGAMRIAFKHPDIFGSVASHSGPVMFDLLMELWREWILEENGGVPPYTYDPEAGVFTADAFSAAGAWSPNPNPPPLVDFPIAEDGHIRSEVMDRWRSNDPIYLVSELRLSRVPRIYFDVGTGDQYFMYEPNVAFAEALDDLGVEYEFQVFEGGHFDQFHTRLPIALAFLEQRRRR